MAVKHTFTSAIADDPTAAAAGQVLPSHWNADHTIATPLTVEPSAATGSALVLKEGSNNGANTITVQAPASLAANYTLTLPVDDGTASQVLQTDGSGVLTWATVAANPGGSDTQVQFNNSGSFGGSSSLTWNGTSLALPSVSLTGNVSAAAWTTSGIGLKHTARTLTDTSSSGTVAAAYTNVLGGNTIAASSATTFTEYASLQIGSPTAGTNVTITNPYSLVAAGSMKAAGNLQLGASSSWDTFLWFDGTNKKNGFEFYYSNYQFGILLNNASNWNWAFGPTSLVGLSSAYFGFCNSSTSTYAATVDLQLTRKAAASLQLGAADAAAPVAQTLGPQSVVAGTSNTAGSTFTIRGSQGTGDKDGGNIAVQVAPKGSSGTSQNALTTAFTVYGDKTLGVTGAFTVAQLPTAGTAGRLARVTDGDSGLAWGATVVNTGAGATPYLVWDNGTNWTVFGK